MKFKKKFVILSILPKKLLLTNYYLLNTHVNYLYIRIRVALYSTKYKNK